jgi:hypothetical protein
MVHMTRGRDDVHLLLLAGRIRDTALLGRTLRRRTGIEPADDAVRRPPILKTGGATRHPDASGADVTRARRGAAIQGLATAGLGPARRGPARQFPAVPPVILAQRRLRVRTSRTGSMT